MSKEAILGSAMWGWTVDRPTVFALLDTFYAAGGRGVDVATNYPIDKNPSHWRRAETWLAEWIAAHGVSDLRVMVKVGSVNNLMTPEQRLAKSFLLLALTEYQHLFGSNLHTYMVHWDNRHDEAAIRDTFAGLAAAVAAGLVPGLSGIRYPDIYARINADHNFRFRIQTKHNLLRSDYARYAPFHGGGRFVAYGINAGGVKLDGHYSDRSSLVQRGGRPGAAALDLAALRRLGTRVDPPLTAFHTFGTLYAAAHPDFSGILLGPSRVAQLRSSLQLLDRIATGALDELVDPLRELAHRPAP